MIPKTSLKEHLDGNIVYGPLPDGLACLLVPTVPAEPGGLKVKYFCSPQFVYFAKFIFNYLAYYIMNNKTICLFC